MVAEVVVVVLVGWLWWWYQKKCQCAGISTLIEQTF